MVEYPARGRVCSKCKKRNHFSAVSRQKVVHRIEPPDTDDDNERDISGEFFIDTVNSQTRSNDPACVDLSRNDKKITVQIDTGAQINILPKTEFNKLHARRVTLHGYGGHKLSNLAVCELECSHKGVTHNLQFHVVDVRAPAIFGLKSCVDISLVKLIQFVDDSGATVDTHRQFNSDQVGLN